MRMSFLVPITAAGIWFSAIPAVKGEETFSLPNYGTRDSWVFEILPKTQTLMPYEPIIVTLKLTNRSNQELTTSWPFRVNRGRSYCTVWDPAGKEIKYIDRDESGHGCFEKALPPGKSIVSDPFNVLDVFNIGERLGKYKIRAAYYFGNYNEDFTADRYCEVECEVNIIEPTTYVDQKASAVFSRAFSAHIHREDATSLVRKDFKAMQERSAQVAFATYETLARYYQSITEKYPQSKYAAYALYYLGVLHEERKEFEAAKNAYQAFLAKEPKHFLAKEARDFLDRRIKRHQTAEKQ